MVERRQNYSWLANAAAGGGLVLTSSRRLARELQGAWDSAQQATGATAWQSPDIRYWQDWLAQGLSESGNAAARRLVGPAASGLLWEQCLDRTGRQDLLSTAAVLRHARQAWQRLHDWCLGLDDIEAVAASRDEHWFLRAARAYAASLDDGGWVDSAQLAGYAMELVDDGMLRLPPRVTHVGFDRPVPAFRQLLERIAARDVPVEEVVPPARSTSPALCSFVDNGAQWRAAGAWARRVLDEEPGARIAIVAPDLDTDAARISQLVREGFAPGWQLGGPRYRDAVNVSYGRPLADFPMICIAELALRFASDGLQSAEASLLLRSAFAGDDDLPGRARLELRLRDLPDRKWSPRDLLAALAHPALEDDGVAWRQRLQALDALAGQAAELADPGTWARRMDETLTAFGWPGSRSPDSDEFQLRNRWRQLLNEFAQLAAVRPAMALPEAQRRLFQLARDTLYQPETPDGGLRLLGMLETAGLEFDHLWVGGLDATRWPPAGHPLALVSRQLQREHGMPDATPADTLAFAKRVLDRLQASAADLQFSWARTDADEERVASPLIDANAARNDGDAGDPGWHAKTWLGSTDLQLPAADDAPPVADGERVRGGAYTIQRMQEEPFDAFARARLAVSDLERFQPGLTPRLRGNKLHDALHRLLADQPTQAELLGWDEDACRERIDEAAWQSLRDLHVHADEVLKRVLQLEKQRIKQLLRDFLQSESERPPFRIVALEDKQVLERGAVRLDLRVDRIDRLADDSLLILDYKSGTKKTFMNRRTGAPANLQLCVYALAQATAVGGVALINIDSREIVYSGEGGSIDWGRIKPDDWPERLADWCTLVEQLIARFAGGEIGVNVQQSADDARALAILSRIEELRREG